MGNDGGRPEAVAEMTSLSIRRVSHALGSECEDCGDLGVNATRDETRLHAERTGHKTRFTVEEVTIYGQQEPRPARSNADAH